MPDVEITMGNTENTRERMSIVVPVYNRPDLVVRCLDSLLAQTYRPLHVTVVDNASTDSTADNVRQWMAGHADEDFSTLLLHEPRRGASYARQTGLESVVTDKVMFFDSDDVMRRDCVERVMDCWSRRPEADAVAWPVAYHYESGVRVSHSIRGNLLERHLVHAIFRTLGYAVKTRFLLDSGGWRGEFPVWDDLETGARILLRDPVVAAIDESLADVYPQVSSITGVDFSSKAGEWEKALDGIEASIKKSGRPDAGRLLNIVSYRRAILAAHYHKEGHPELSRPLYLRSLVEVSGVRRVLLRFSYQWTRRGLRGAFSLVGRFL